MYTSLTNFIVTLIYSYNTCTYIYKSLDSTYDYLKTKHQSAFMFGELSSIKSIREQCTVYPFHMRSDFVDPVSSKNSMKVISSSEFQAKHEWGFFLSLPSY